MVPTPNATLANVKSNATTDALANATVATGVKQNMTLVAKKSNSSKYSNTSYTIRSTVNKTQSADVQNLAIKLVNSPILNITVDSNGAKISVGGGNDNGNAGATGSISANNGTVGVGGTASATGGVNVTIPGQVKDAVTGAVNTVKEVVTTAEAVTHQAADAVKTVSNVISGITGMSQANATNITVAQVNASK